MFKKYQSALLAITALAFASTTHAKVLGEEEASAPAEADKCGVTYENSSGNQQLRQSANYVAQVVKPACDAFLAKQTNRESWKCVYLPQDILGDAVAENLARVGIFKMLNHTAMDIDKSVVGQDASEGRGIVFAFDINAYWPQGAAEKWQVIASAQGRRLSIDLQRPNEKSNVPSLKPFDPNQPVAADQLVYNLSFPYIYHELIDHPPFHGELLGQADLGIERQGDQFKAVGFGAVADSVTNPSTGREDGSITESARIFYLYRTTDNRLLWDATDDFEGRVKAVPYTPGGDDVPKYRAGAYANTNMVQVGNAQIHANESRLEMKNGCFANYIWGNTGQERLLAEKTFVKDYLNPSADEFLLNGRSCIACHEQGVWNKMGSFAKQVEDNPNQFSAEGRQAWLSATKLAELYEHSTQRWIEGCMKPVVCEISSAEEAVNDEIIQGVFTMPGFDKDLDPYNPQQRPQVYEAHGEPTMFLIRHWEKANPAG